MSDTKINMDDEREKIRQDIENDFLNCIAEFQIVKFLKNKILESDFQDIEDLFQTLNYDGIKRKQFDSLCKSMGQICEYVFKFLIKIKHTEIYKNHTFDDFSRTQALYNIGSLKKLVQLRYITEDDLNDITSRFSSQNKDKLHNFTYLSMIVEKLMPQTYKNMRRYFELSYCGKLAYIDYCEHKSNSNSYMEYYEALEDILFPNPDRMDQEKKEQFIKEMRNVQTKFGDAFNRLRYFSNNVEGKRYDPKLMYAYTEAIVSFIMEVRDKNNNLLIDPELLVAREQAIKHHKLLELDVNEINDIFNKYVYNPDIPPIDLRTELAPMLIGCYSYEEVREINEKCKRYGFNPLEIYRTGITFEERLFFHELGWDKKGYIEDIVDGFVYDGKRRRTLDQVKYLINNLKNRLGEEVFNYFINNGIFYPLYMIHCSFNEDGKKRPIVEIKQMLDYDYILSELYELGSNDYNDIDLDRLFAAYGINDRDEKIKYIYEENGKKRTIREVMELLIENQEKNKER